MYCVCYDFHNVIILAVLRLCIYLCQNYIKNTNSMICQPFKLVYIISLRGTMTEKTNKCNLMCQPEIFRAFILPNCMKSTVRYCKIGMPMFRNF